MPVGASDYNITVSGGVLGASDYLSYSIYCNNLDTVMFLSFRTDKCGQTV